jgi:hypothetical protein
MAFPKLKPDEGIEGALCGTFRILTGPVRIFLPKAAANDEKAVALAKSAHHSFLRIERRAREYAADKLLETYHENWRAFAEGDGFVQKPELSARSFAIKLTPMTLEIYDSVTVCIWFDTKDLFGGHRILVTLRDGGNECIDAQLWG